MIREVGVGVITLVLALLIFSYFFGGPYTRATINDQFNEAFSKVKEFNLNVNQNNNEAVTELIKKGLRK